MLAIVAPGQGAQTPGFLTPWLELPSFATRLAWLSAVAGMDLAHYGTAADADEIRDTAVAQPLLVAAGLLSALELFPHPADAFGIVGVAAGHSVGEITAAAATGVLSAEQAMVFVRERGQGMAAASAVQPTSMMACVGGDEAEVLARLEELGLTPANHNGSGQIVAAGTVAQLDELKANPPARCRVIPLSVAGAFHTEHMQPAVARLAQLGNAISTHDPRVRLLSNRDGLIITDGREYLRRLIDQVANPVRWDACLNSMRDLGVTGILELPPAGTLVNIAKRNLTGVERFALNTPDEIDAAREFVRQHATPGSAPDLGATPSWSVVVAPLKGTFRRATAVDEGTDLAAGSSVGTVSNLRESIDVVASHDGRLVEWVVADDDPVRPGQAIARLYPAEESRR